jgi:MoxR-like ATPase
MDASLLFRKKSALTDEGLDWLKGSEELAYAARRNAASVAAVSAILVRALLAALDGGVRQGTLHAEGVQAQVASKSTPGATGWCWQTATRWHMPRGEPNKLTYHFGLLVIVEALADPARAQDFWGAYVNLQSAYQKHGKTPALKEPLVRCGDELYYLSRYGDASPSPGADRFPKIEIAESTGASAPGGVSLDVAPLTDPDALQKLLTKATPIKRPKAKSVAKAPSPRVDGFVGWQVPALASGLQEGLNVLLAGPTGTGKTYAVQQAVLESLAALITIEGKEGLTDLDFLGAILPQVSGERRWVDGPLLRAMRQAQHEPVVLFLDEINRVRREYLNLLLGLMNPKSQALCERQGLAVAGSAHYYVVEVPLTSEVVWCPVEHLRVIGAGNFGGDYAVYPLDPAVRRRFDLVLDFDYLSLAQELMLLEARVPLEAKVAQALCLVAQYTRQMRRNGDLPGCIDTASLLNWARLCAQQSARTVAEVMRLGQRVWADLACGRDHLGLVRSAKYAGLTDYLVSQGVLPKGEVAEV